MIDSERRRIKNMSKYNKIIINDKSVKIACNVYNKDCAYHYNNRCHASTLSLIKKECFNKLLKYKKEE